MSKIIGTLPTSLPDNSNTPLESQISGNSELLQPGFIELPLEAELVRLPNDILYEISSNGIDIYYCMIQLCKSMQHLAAGTPRRFLQYYNWGRQGPGWRLPWGALHAPDIHTPSSVRRGVKSWHYRGHLQSRANGDSAMEWPNGTKKWYRQGQLHRTEGPAVTRPNGYCEYWYYGMRHRDDGPAIIEANGTKKWYRQNLLHRDNDEPAVVWADGKMEWYNRGERHREQGPAVLNFTMCNGVKHFRAEWWWKNNLHRDNDEPAVVEDDTYGEYWVHGKLHRGNNLPAIVDVLNKRAEYWTHGINQVGRRGAI